MVYPKYLEKGDYIGVTAPDEGNLNELKIVRTKNAINKLKEYGFKVIPTPNLWTNEKGRSSPKKQRAKEFMDLIQNEDVKAIITLTGGDYMMEVLPYLNFEKIKENPKWVQGYSDTTILVYVITTMCDIVTSYSHNLRNMGMNSWYKSIEENFGILQGRRFIQESFDKYENESLETITGLEEYNLDTKVEWKNAKSEEEIILDGRLLGGNIEALNIIVGTRFDKTKEYIEKYKEDGIIWYLENYSMPSEQMTASLWRLKEAGYFKYVKGFVFGRTNYRGSHYDISYEDAIMQAIEDLGVPIILEADFGHKPPMFTMLNGSLAKITSRNGKGILEYRKENIC